MSEKETPDDQRNPEVMGRTEPREVEARDMRERDMQERNMKARDTQQRDMPRRDTTPRDTRSERIDKDHPTPRSDSIDLWPDMHDYRRRLVDIQSEFIDQPREAVKKAELLVQEMLDYMSRSMHEHLQQMHKEVDGDADTEKLRLVMRRYGEVIDRLDGRRAA